MNTFAPVTLGTTLSTRLVDGFILTDTWHTPATRLSAHAHEHAALSMVIEGAYRQRFAGGELVCTPGLVMIEPAEREHRTDYSNVPTRTFILEALPTLKLNEASRSRAAAGYRLSTSPALSRAMRLLAEAFYSSGTSDPGYLQCAALDVAAELACDADERHDRRGAFRIRKFLDEESPANLGLTRLSEDVGLHPVHLCRIFKQRYHMTIGEYVQTLRVRRAMKDLATTDRSLIDIALRCGFADQSHLGRVFRAHTGFTPRSYRHAMVKR